MEGSGKIIEDINKGHSVLIHCSDGWDRTAQLSGVAQVCLDSYYRSIEGLSVLIEKEFLSFGHMFQERIGHGDRNYDNQQRSPIFLQFVDVLFQLHNQFPTAFEWNENFLITMMDSLYSCQFGTWLCNNERERANMKSKTISFWTYVQTDKEKYKNPFFVQSSGVIRPFTSIIDIVLWKGYYCRWQRNLSHIITKEKRMEQVTKERDALAAQIAQLMQTKQ